MSHGDFKVRGTIRCPIYKRYTMSGKTHTMPSGEYDLPALLDVKCKGEGEQRRCVATYSDCPRPAPHEGEPIPATAEVKKVRGLRPPEGIVRSRDNGGNWNTRAAWHGREGYTGDRNERGNEQFEIQVWDERPDLGPERDVFFDAAEFRRPYPRAEKRLERDGWHMRVDRDGMREVTRSLRESAARGVSRGIEREEFKKSPPIRLGDEEIDWPGRGLDGLFRGRGRSRRSR